MARVLVLDFKDKDAAEKVIELLDELQASEESPGRLASRMQALGTIMASSAQVKLFHARPTAGCKCVRRGRIQGWSRTERFGWFVCPECNRPASLVVRRWFHNINLSVGANDLLQETRDKQIKQGFHVGLDPVDDGSESQGPVQVEGSESQGQEEAGQPSTFGEEVIAHGGEAVDPVQGVVLDPAVQDSPPDLPPDTEVA